MKLLIFVIKMMRWILLAQKVIKEKAAIRRPVYVNDRIGFYKDMWSKAAAIVGADIKILSDGFWEFSKDSKAVRIHNYMVPLDDPVTLRIAGTKDLCYKLMNEENIPIPDHTVFEISNLEKGLKFFKEKKGPFVIKPSSGTSGARGVSLWVTKYINFISAVALASLYDKRIIIEQMIMGESYRLLFLDKRLIHAARRTGVRVTGDGSSSLLLLFKSLQGSSYTHSDLKKDLDLKYTIESQGYTLETIPKKGEQILVKSFPASVRGANETITEYTENITGKISQSIIETAQKASLHLNIYFSGIDLITTDPTIPLEQSGGAIIEVNSTPGLHHHYNLTGQSDDDQPAVTVLKRLLSIDKNKNEFL